MFNLTQAVRTLAIWKDDRYGPVPGLLLLLTMVSGIVDAVSYLKLGRIFVANMTGNVVFLGFAIADPHAFSVPASLVAIGAFFIGAFTGGQLSLLRSGHRGMQMTFTILLEIALVGAALVTSISASNDASASTPYALIVLLALAMGLQNATARHIAIPDLTTTVLTLTITGLGADLGSSEANGSRLARRLGAIASMLLGAAVGASLVYYSGISAALALAMTLLACAGTAAYRYAWSSAAGAESK